MRIDRETVDAGWFASDFSTINGQLSTVNSSDYLPVNLGARFSMNAATPSLKSSESQRINW